MSRLIDAWTGGSSPLRRFDYRLVEEAGAYRLECKLAELPESAWEVVEYGHHAAQRMAGHLRLEDLERAEWRRRRA